DGLGHGRSHVVEFLFPAVSGHGAQSAGDRVLDSSVAPCARPAPDRLGWSAESSQPRGMGFCAPAEGPALVRVPSRVRAGTKSRGISVGTLEAARTTYLLSR